MQQALFCSICFNGTVCISFNMSMLLKQYMKKEKLNKSTVKLIRFWFGRLWSSGEHWSLHTSGSAPGYWALHQDGAE